MCTLTGTYTSATSHKERKDAGRAAYVDQVRGGEGGGGVGGGAAGGNSGGHGEGEGR